MKREYQQQAIQQLNILLNNSRHPVYLAPCGTGKTYTAAQLIQDRISLDRRVFVIVPQMEIFNEWMKVLIEHGLEPGYINDEGIRGKNRDVYVCMALSLVNNVALLPESIYPDEIITDEMQHSLACSWESIYRYFPNALRIGLTATLYHGSLRSFEHLYTDVVQTISKSAAIAQGYITKPLLVVPEKWCEYVPKNGDDFDREAQSEILGNAQIIGNVIDFYGRTFAGKPVIVPCSTHEHAKMMCEEFAKEGWLFEHLHSELPKNMRKHILRNVAAGRNNGICTVGIGIEGMSIPGLYGVLWLRRTLSPIIWTQFNGRAERVLRGKSHYVCADFVGNSIIHGMPDRDLFWKLEGEGGEETPEAETTTAMVMCMACGVMNSTLNHFCHFCGSPLSGDDMLKVSTQFLPAMVDGKLVVVKSDAQAQEIETRIHSIQQKQAEDRKKDTSAREISEPERTAYMHRNLFKGSKRKLFTDAVKDFLA
tara:strand:- start:483 stop:1922 length:1440 start_codon:yes stop_codon:yes gene_type:complete